VLASNYQDVIDQLRSVGLVGRGVDDGLQVGTARPVRCRVEGDREKRGWYWLHDLTTSSGDALIVGTFGVWQGDSSNTQKVELRKTEISADQREALKRRLADDRKRMEAERRREVERAASKASSAWLKCSSEGADQHAYIVRKKVRGFGLRVSPSGALVVPMMDVSGRIHGLQLIRTAAATKAAERPEKEYWPPGLAKTGHFHLIGAPQPGEAILVGEGFATAASLHIASGRPAAVAFDANNLRPVCEALRKSYPRSPILVCADDDALAKCHGCSTRLVLADHPKACPSCGAEHRRVNTGCQAAEAAALAGRGAWIRPVFADEETRRAAFLDHGTKLTDFNDLADVQGQAAVGHQLQAHLRQIERPEGFQAPGHTANGVGGEYRPGPIRSSSHLEDRFVLIEAHGGAVFDRSRHQIISLSDMRDLCQRPEHYRDWRESPNRVHAESRQVGFDPTQRDTSITCNLYGGWPTQPQAGQCGKLLDLLRYMCSGDANAEALFRWVLCWIAYPIQHPGAKMKSTLVLHGPQGTGKNLFFEAVMAIYGLYGDVIDQSAIEDKFNDWASRKLFLIADEVVARSDLYHVKNKLKALITGDRIRINPKNFAAYWERNCVNLVFLSNEAMPVVLEEDDRRHCVIWTPPKRPPAYYAEVMREVAEGGTAALHDYLLRLDLGDFGPGSRPPETDAKNTLLNLSLDSPERWHDALVTGDIDGVKPCTGKAEDWFRIYEIWCRRNNVRVAPTPKFINALDRKRGVSTRRERFRTPNGAQKNPLSILYLGDGNPPEGVDRPAWLGTQVVAVAQQLDAYREAK
jgi:putative DNA primase/helicase